MHSMLIPVDGSKPAKRALRYAITTIKEGLRAEIYVLNVQPDVFIMGDLVMMDVDLIKKYQEEQASKILKDAVNLVTKMGLNCHKAMLHGPIAPSIANFAKSHGCGSIVMGTRGMGMLGNLVLGSTANQVVHLAKIPVTLIK